MNKLEISARLTAAFAKASFGGGEAQVVNPAQVFSQDNPAAQVFHDPSLGRDDHQEKAQRHSSGSQGHRTEHYSQVIGGEQSQSQNYSTTSGQGRSRETGRDVNSTGTGYEASSGYEQLRRMRQKEAMSEKNRVSYDGAMAQTFQDISLNLFGSNEVFESVAQMVNQGYEVTVSDMSAMMESGGELMIDALEQKLANANLNNYDVQKLAKLDRDALTKLGLGEVLNGQEALSKKQLENVQELVSGVAQMLDRGDDVDQKTLADLAVPLADADPKQAAKLLLITLMGLGVYKAATSEKLHRAFSKIDVRVRKAMLSVLLLLTACGAPTANPTQAVEPGPTQAPTQQAVENPTQQAVPTEIEGTISTPTVDVSTPESSGGQSGGVEVLPGGQPGVGGVGDWVSHTAESGGGSVKTDQLRELDLARIVSEGSVLSMEDRSTDLVYLPYLKQPINVEVNGEMVAYNFDHVDDGFAYYSSNGDMVKTPIRMPAIDGKQVVGVVNFGVNGNGEIGFASLTSNGEIDQLFLGLVFGQSDAVTITEVGGLYQISVKNEQGSFTLESTDTGEWDLVAKEYTSCLDGELRETIRTNMEEQLGMTASEYFQELIKIPEFAASGQYAFDFQAIGDKIAGIGFISGATEVSLANLPGFSKGDVAMCVYFSTADAPNEMIPVVHSYTKNGEYVKAFAYKDSTGSETNFNNHRSMDETRKFFGEMGKNEIGNVAWLYIHRFGAGATDADFDTPDGEKLSYSYGINWLVDALETDYLSRVETADRHPLAMVEQLDPDLGDVGLIADYTRVIHKRK